MHLPGWTGMSNGSRQIGAGTGSRPSLADALRPGVNGRPVRARAFTVIELLVVISIMALLMSILLPALARARDAGRGMACRSNLRQMTTALHMYLEDHEGRMFPWREHLPEGRLWWPGFEAAAGPTAEGERVIDRTRGRLWFYYRHSDSIEICPAFPLHSSNYKPKFTTNWTTYAPPLALMNPSAPVRRDEIERPWEVLAFADAAQINTFQPPASPSRPMFEQWFYVSGHERTVMYHHGLRAHAAAWDGHVASHDPPQTPVALFPEAPISYPPTGLRLTAK